MAALNVRELCDQIETLVAHYEKSAPTVAEYLDGLYRRLNAPGGFDQVRLSEAGHVAFLFGEGQDEGRYVAPNVAANLTYKLMSRLGMDVTGHAGF